jgi:DNA polymerase-3 subunit alpha
MVTGKRVRTTKKNESMAFLQAEDSTGTLELIVFPKEYARLGSLAETGSIRVFQGEAELVEAREEDRPPELKLILKNVSNPDTISEKKPAILQEAPKGKSLYLKVTAENSLHLERALALSKAIPGEARILVYFAEEKKLRAVKGATCSPDDSLLQSLKRLLGDENVALK